MAAKAFIGIPVSFCSFIRRHLFVSVVRVTKTAFHRLILFETGAGQKRAVSAGKDKEWATTGRCDLMGGRGYSACQHYSNRTFGGGRLHRIGGEGCGGRNGARAA